MEAVEFLQCYYKMCKSYASSCVGCEAQGIDCKLTTDDPERLVAIVEKWAKEHHVKPEQERHEPEHHEESSDLHAIIDELEDRIDKLEKKVSNEALIFREVSKRNQKTHRKLADRIAALEKDPVESMNEPKRTNKDVLLAVLPNVDTSACPKVLDMNYKCDKRKLCAVCKHEFWNEEVEE